MIAEVSTAPLSIIAPLPVARRLPAQYNRHHPCVESQRHALRELVGGTNWSDHSWQQLIAELLALGRTDIPLSRLAEGHVDAVRILGQAGASPLPSGDGAAEPALYGVWASRSMQTGLSGRRVAGGHLLVDGTIRFASGAGVVDRALVPAWFDDGHHELVDLATAGLPVDASVWRTGAMAASRTHELRLESVPIDSRQSSGRWISISTDQVLPGGVGVAACWAGGAARLVDLLRERHPVRRPRSAASPWTHRRRSGVRRQRWCVCRCTT